VSSDADTSRGATSPPPHRSHTPPCNTRGRCWGLPRPKHTCAGDDDGDRQHRIWPSGRHHFNSRSRRAYDGGTPELHGRDHGGSPWCSAILQRRWRPAIGFFDAGDRGGGRSRTKPLRPPRGGRRPPPGHPARHLEPSHPARHLEPSRAWAPRLQPLTAGLRPAADARRRTGAAGQHKKGRGESRACRPHQAPVDPPMGDTAGRPAGHRRRRQRRQRLQGTGRPEPGMDGGGCGLGVTLTVPPPPLLFDVAGWANQATRAVNRPAGPQAEGSDPQAAQPPCSQKSVGPPSTFQKSRKPL
jgi:hypothetical protein